MASLWVMLATSGRCSQISMPETAVGMGRNSPRISGGASGFMSKLSMCEGPPRIQIMMTDLARDGFLPAAAARARPRSTSVRLRPANDRVPACRTSRRETPSRHFRSGP
jgi:hypothetical protein